MKNRFFSYIPQDGLYTHETETEAISRASGFIKMVMDEGGEFDEGELEGVCWGEIKGIACKVESLTIEDLTESGDDYRASVLESNGWDSLDRWALVNNDSLTQRFGFGQAINYLKDGHRVRRAGWNEKDVWLVSSHLPHPRMGPPYIYASTIIGDPVLWTCSQTDMLSNDWELVERSSIGSRP